MTEQVAKYTPGPWKATPNSDISWQGMTIEAENAWMGLIAEVLGGHGKPRETANAHLLAASPLMLEVLQGIEWQLTYHHEEPGTFDCPECGSEKEEGHDSTCKLNIAIKAALNLD